MATDIKDIRERYSYAKDGWREIRDEGAIDMRYVAGDPFDDDDKAERKDRPTVAPEEMGQYFNQVINALRANPRGMKFAPTGNGANDKGAEFYQNKAREIEYRSHAQLAYITAAENAIQRSYGFVRVDVRYASPRDANPEIFIDPFPDPDMVLPDPDALRPDSSDQKYCFVLRWTDQQEFKRSKLGKEARFTNLTDFSHAQPDWIQGSKILEAEYWEIATKPRTLLLVSPPAPQAQGYMVAPPQAQAPKPFTVFKDEIDVARIPVGSMIRELREVDYPTVKMYRTNGLEILHEQAWAGKYLPIISCYGKVLFVPEGGQIKRKILSMTRFGRDPWKSYCYACSQELEVLAMVPKAPLLIARGSMTVDELKAVEESIHQPKAYLTYGATDGSGQQQPPPQRPDYLQAQYLAGIEQVKEGFRRAIQAAMGSNFLPTQAQRRNEKSGVALDKINQAATSGTYHFVDSYEHLIRQTGVVFEDLCDKIYDYAGEVGVMEADEKASTVVINDPAQKDSVSTKGDYNVTVSTAPSSDSQRDAADEFIQSLVGQLPMIAQVSGPKVAAAVLAKGIRMLNLGPMGDQLADLIEPDEFKSKDGQPPNPQLLAAQGQIQKLTQMLQQAAQEKHAKVVEITEKGKVSYAIEQMKVEATSQDKAADREVKLAVAELAAKVDRQALFMEERDRLGVRIAQTLDRLHEHLQATRDRVHEDIQNVKDRAHEHVQAVLAHDRAQELAAQGVAGQMATQQQAADLAPPPSDNGAGA